MKSFFKKLAFIMALAMVVSMAAPAGTAVFAADFYIADEANKKATNYKLAIGEKEDFSFKGAPTDWKTYSWTWTSSDAKVLTVDKTNGLATGVKDGVATITVTGVKEGVKKYEATCKVSVGNGGAVEYSVKQLTVGKMEIVFDGDHDYKIDNVVLFYVLDDGTGERQEVAWPIKERKVDDEGNFEITPFVAFEDGNAYIVKVSAEDEGLEFVTEFGAPDRIDLNSFKCVETGTEQKLYSTPEDARDVINKVDFKLYSGDVDVTDLWKNEGELEFGFEYTSDADNSDIDSETGEIVFTADRVEVIVKAIFEYDDESGETQTLYGWSEVPMKSEPLPAYKIKAVTKWTIVRPGIDTAIDWNKPVHSLAAYDDTTAGSYKIVALITDNFGYTYVTDPAFESIVPGDKAKSIYKLTEDENGDETPFAERGYEIAFESADVTKLLAGTEGFLTTYTKCTVPVLIGLVDTEKDDSEISRYVGAVPVKVEEAREIDKITSSSGRSTVTLVTQGNDTVNDDDETVVAVDPNGVAYTKESVRIYLTDQHGKAWTKNETIAVSANVLGAKISGYEWNEDGERVAADNKITYKGSDKYATLTFDGAALKAAVDAKVKNITFTLKVGEEELDIKVALKAPQFISENSTNVEVEKWKLSVSDINQKVTEKSRIPATGIIALTQLSNNLEVGTQTGVELYDINKVTSTDPAVYYNRNTVSVNDRFLVVYGPDNAIISETLFEDELGIYKREDGSFKLIAAAVDPDNEGEIEYLKTGTYKAQILYVYDFEDDTTVNNVVKPGRAKFKSTGTKAYSATFTVSNDSAAVTYAGSKADSTESTLLKAIVRDTLLFNIGGQGLDLANMSNADLNDIIKTVEYRHNPTSGHIIITRVVFNIDVRSDNEKDSEHDDYDPERLGYLQYVTVNKAIQLENGLASENPMQDLIEE